MRKRSTQVLILVGGFVVAGCSSSSPDASGAGTGGALGVGGQSIGAGGSSITSVGGVTNSGGALAAGGAGATGTAAGGLTSAGGTSATGGTAVGGGTVAAGNSTTGGATAAGGNSVVGGAAVVGGSSATGGRTTGGVTSAGGVTVAGAKATGGSGAASGSTAIGGAATCAPPTITLTGNDAVAGTLITFSDNGGWCWYQDERAVVDVAGGKLVIGSVASGGSVSGNVNAVVYDIAAGTKKQSTLGNMSIDDHNAPAIVVRPDGKYVAMWAGHHFDCYSNYSIYDGSAWGTKKQFNWTPEGCTWDNDTTHSITYSNLWYMSAEKTYYSGVRSVNTSPNFLYSTDDGATWSYYGRLTSTTTVGYVAGYYKYWGNGTDRIDFVGTEAHPRDNDNNLWHGYFKGGAFYNSAGTVVDSVAKDKTGKDVSAYTKVLATGSTLGSVKLSHLWNADVVRYEDGTLGFIGTGRANTTTSTDAPDLRLFYARFDGTSWKATYLAKAGPKLYPDEQDYTGLGALDPDDPHTIYISTPIDPRDDTTALGKREIFRGTTCDNGAKFTWTPVTQKSTMDNIRPIVPKWDASHTALLWLRGTYTSAQNYAMKVVGTISTE